MNKQKAAFILVLVIALAGIVPAAAQEDACYERFGVWDPEAGRCVIREGLDIALQVPITDQALIAQTVDPYLDGLRRDFIAEYVGAQEEDFWFPGMWSLMVNYEVIEYSATVQSYLFLIHTYMGGAHGDANYKTFTFDFAQNRVLTLDDLFQPGSDPLAVIAPLAQQQLTEQLGEMSDAQWIQTGTAPDPANYQHFVLTPDSLNIYFPPYQVAAYAAGPQSVSIRLSALSAILAPAFMGG